MLNNFVYYAPTKVIFGTDAELSTGALLQEAGAKSVMLVHFGYEVKVLGELVTRVRKNIEAAGIKVVELTGIVPNPRLSKVYEGIELAKAEKVDYLLAIGGGSSIDTAKAIGLGLCYEGDVWDFFIKKANPTDCVPVSCILTIAAAGSEMSTGLVITHDESLLKRDCGHPSVACRFAIMNPDITLSLPAYQTASGCADIIMHTFERYISSHNNLDLTDQISEGLMRTVIANAKILAKEPHNKKARWEVMWAASLSHNGLTGCGIDEVDFPVHMIEHELGGMFDVTHGAGITAIWGTWAREMLPILKDRFSQFAIRVFGIEEQATQEQTSLLGIIAMEDFFKEIKMPISLKELGISPTDEQIETLATLSIHRTLANPQMKEAVTKEQALNILYNSRK
ncbi:iron-containing alcohol dehydrogenase [Candidatus Epulonipiscium viviparus]|uniref:iron-containing alcohol dehydrogenase n=1 Tax=Candidatus Epulonipiscium viviparus TaxID=420336 RepID=UPI00016C06FC|nr:iron-containing alcohol dehydrogenase [Candidatus Epulopiscium viviparus]